MDQETFNLSIRKFLKMVGVNSQREIEQAVQQALQQKKLSGSETLQAHMKELGFELIAIGAQLPIGVAGDELGWNRDPAEATNHDPQLVDGLRGGDAAPVGGQAHGLAVELGNTEVVEGVFEQPGE